MLRIFKLLYVVLFTVFWVGCVTLPNNHTILVEKEDGTFVKHNTVLDRSKVIEKEDPFYVLLNDTYITENGDWFWDYVGYSPGAEIAIVAIIDDGRVLEEKDSQEVLVHFSRYVEDFSELPFNSIPIYSSTGATPKYLRIKLRVYDLDQQENESASALLELLSSYASQVPNQYSQALGLLSKAGQFIVSNNPDDIILEYDFTLVPYMESVGELDENPVLQQTRYRLVGHDNDTLDTSNLSIANDRITENNLEKSPYPQVSFTIAKGDLGVDLATLKANLKKMFDTLKGEYETDTKKTIEILKETVNSTIAALEFRNKFDPKKAKSTIPIVAKALSLGYGEKIDKEINLFLISKLFPSTSAIVTDLNDNKTEADWVAFAAQYQFTVDPNTKKVLVN